MSKLTLKLLAKTTGATAAGKTVGLPLAPSSFFGAFAGAPLIKIFWDKKNPDKSIRKAYTLYETDSWKKYDKDHVKIDEGSISNSSDWAPTHEYESEGSNKVIEVLGGYAADGGLLGGLLAFSQTSKQTNGVAAIDDQRHADATPEKITKILKCAKDGFYVHGQGDFAMFTGLLVATGLKTACMLKSADPAAAISLIKAGARSWLGNHTFYNTPNYEGKPGRTQNELQPWGKKLDDSGVTDSASLKSAQSTFEGSGFDGTVKAWDFSAVENFINMFKDATNFKGRGLGRMLNPKLKPGGGRANPARGFAAALLQGFLQNCPAVKNKHARKLRLWDVQGVTNVTNCFGGTTNITVDFSGWNVGNVTNAAGFGGSGTAPSFSANSTGHPESILVTPTWGGSAAADPVFPDDGPTPYNGGSDTYTYNDPTNFASSVYNWDDPTDAFEDELNHDLAYYSQDDVPTSGAGQGTLGFWIVLNRAKDEYLLINADTTNSYDLSDVSDITAWAGTSGGTNGGDLINVADND